MHGKLTLSVLEYTRNKWSQKNKKSIRRHQIYVENFRIGKKVMESHYKEIHYERKLKRNAHIILIWSLLYLPTITIGHTLYSHSWVHFKNHKTYRKLHKYELLHFVVMWHYNLTLLFSILFCTCSSIAGLLP